MDKLCCFCTRFHLDMGDPGYSDLTPGWDASIECSKGKWEMGNGDDANSYRKNITQAEFCEMYDQVFVNPQPQDKEK